MWRCGLNDRSLNLKASINWGNLCFFHKVGKVISMNAMFLSWKTVINAPVESSKAYNKWWRGSKSYVCTHILSHGKSVIIMALVYDMFPYLMGLLEGRTISNPNRCNVEGYTIN